MSSTGALPGFRDFYPAECAEREHVFRAWRAVAKRYAFVEYDGPPLEALELYTKKSGDEIVGQLYAFTDKGGREVALRPEMTPSFARMVAARANSLRKPLKWFSIPQLFRYERAQKGRLREHFQLNVDIVGEPSEVADAELMGVSIDVMRELGLTDADVRVRVSDRRLLFAGLSALGFDDSQRMASLGVIDKLARQPREVSVEKLRGSGISPPKVEQLLSMVETRDLDAFVAAAGGGDAVRSATQPLRTAMATLDGFGLKSWIDFDPTIVRGLAYYTGIVFELFDARGEFRAICGGGRYDELLKSLGGVDLPALGFGMGDVVLSELLRARKLMPPDAGTGTADLYVVGPVSGAARSTYRDALQLVRALREADFSVEFPLSEDRYLSFGGRNRFEAARKSGARAAIYFDAETPVTAKPMRGPRDAPAFAVRTDDTLRIANPDELRHWLASLNEFASDG